MIPGVNKPSLRVYLIGGPFRKVLVYFLHRSFWIRSESTSKPLKGTRSTHEWRESWFRWILLVLCPSIQPSNLDRDCGLFCFGKEKKERSKNGRWDEIGMFVYTQIACIYIYIMCIYTYMYIHTFHTVCFVISPTGSRFVWLCGSRPVPGTLSAAMTEVCARLSACAARFSK